MTIKLIKTYSPNENATRLKQQEQDAQTIEDALNKQSSDLDTHENAKIAHSASQISYEGTNVDTALKAVNAYVDNLVIEASKGDSNAEVVAARTTYNGTTFTSLKTLLDTYWQKVDNGQNSRITQDDGKAYQRVLSTDSSILDIVQPLSGVHSWYIQGGNAGLPTGESMRALSVFSEPSMGWVLGTSGSGDMYINTSYLDTSNAPVWKGWSKIATESFVTGITNSINTQKINTLSTKIADATISGETYPIGITIQELDTTNSGFPTSYGIVETHKLSNSRLTQYFYNTGNTNPYYEGGWARHWRTTYGWSKWYSVFGTNSWCNVSVTAEQSLTQAVTQKVKFNRIINDSHSQFNTSNSRFIAKVRGMYMVGVGLYIYQVRKYNNIQIFLYKNGTHYKTVYQLRENPHDQNENEWNTGHYNSGVNVPLEVGDYLEIFVHVGSGQDLRISDKAGQYNYFDIYRFGDIPINVTI
ncbi:hypothetical protein P9D80_03065 [Bacillus spizizenii]|uniref:C1q-like domain-containing protein n=1 Tax=Bacillus spizizenii TaxID=96241 RepID=UPI002DB7B951|nr:hypothetical protein [Bacillus spizizenii]MEC1584345.1 hypothetical protein [Bacillus spizizenii]